MRTFGAKSRLTGPVNIDIDASPCPDTGSTRSRYITFEGILIGPGLKKCSGKQVQVFIFIKVYLPKRVRVVEEC